MSSSQTWLSTGLNWELKEHRFLGHTSSASDSMGNMDWHQRLSKGRLWLWILCADTEIGSRLKVNPEMILLLLSQALPPPVPMGKRFPAYTEQWYHSGQWSHWSSEPKVDYCFIAWCGSRSWSQQIPLMGILTSSYEAGCVTVTRGWELYLEL